MSYEQGPHVYSRQELTYNTYLKVEELLKLQVCQSNPPHHDETLFIIIHQVYELWFKQILHEMTATIRAMQKRQLLRAFQSMDRVVKIMRVLVNQIHIIETMAPAEFLKFRDLLNPASGFQSIQFREMEFLAGLRDTGYLKLFKNWPEYTTTLERRLAEPNLRSTFYSLLRAEGIAVPDSLIDPDGQLSDAERAAVIDELRHLYEYPDRNLRLYLLAEALVDFDESLVLWRQHHCLMVERVIGGRTGTGGSAGVRYLESTASKRCFPLLWEVRTCLRKVEVDETEVPISGQ